MILISLFLVSVFLITKKGITTEKITWKPKNEPPELLAIACLQQGKTETILKSETIIRKPVAIGLEKNARIEVLELILLQKK